MWEFIHKYNVPYCKLYDAGYARLGCIGCPMSNNAKQEIEAHPTYKRAYLRAFDKMLKERAKRGKDTTWNTAEEVMEWWTTRKQDKSIDGQIEMEFENE